MCGIVGYVGRRAAAPLLVEGLRRLEYRGYDSAGVCTVNGDGLNLLKKAGRLDAALAPLLAAEPPPGATGIGHTRWATHGPPTDANSHPHLDRSGQVALVHNGVIENYGALRRALAARGHTFRSDTDTEVLAHLVGAAYERTRGGPAGEQHPLAAAVAEALRQVVGTYGLAVVAADAPGVIVAARRGSPLIIGVGQDEHLVASDASALVAHTRDAVYLHDFDLATVRAEGVDIRHLEGEAAAREVRRIEFDAAAADRGAFPHFMLKEIHEQPQTVRNVLRGRLDREEITARFGGLNLSAGELRAVDRVVIVACGTSWHAGLLGEYVIEELAGLPVEVEYASEFRYRNAPLDKHTLVLAITQSGETADTLAGLREARRRGHKALALCNVVGSTIAREADGGIYLHAGPEIGVASTKAFTAQAVTLVLLGLLLGRLRNLPPTRALELIQALEALPGHFEEALAGAPRIEELAAKHGHCEDFFFLGRQGGFPVALEGALKLKEISYLHAEGYPAAEMKHGPIAMVDWRTPCLVLAPPGPLHGKVAANIAELRARGAPVVALTAGGHSLADGAADEIIELPATHELLFPLLAVVPLQLFAYQVAVRRGHDVDKPRNLAKSVTVE